MPLPILCNGPWLTYARMKTLRSPKDFTGPDLDIPSLTYQSWHEARFGAADFAALDLIELCSGDKESGVSKEGNCFELDYAFKLVQAILYKLKLQHESC